MSVVKDEGGSSRKSYESSRASETSLSIASAQSARSGSAVAPLSAPAPAGNGLDVEMRMGGSVGGAGKLECPAADWEVVRGVVIKEEEGERSMGRSPARLSSGGLSTGSIKEELATMCQSPTHHTSGRLSTDSIKEEFSTADEEPRMETVKERIWRDLASRKAAKAAEGLKRKRSEDNPSEASLEAAAATMDLAQSISPVLPPGRHSTRPPSPARSTTSNSTLSELASTPSQSEPSPMAGTAFAALNGNHTPAPAKKKRKLTFQEQEALRIEKQFKDQEKADKKEGEEIQRKKAAEQKAAAKAQEQAEIEARKKKKAEDLAVKKAAMDAAKAAKEDRKREKEEAKREKDEAKREKEEAKRRKEEEDKKKLGTQKTLMGFLKQAAGKSSSSAERTSASPAPSAAPVENAVATPSKSRELSYYERKFLPFFKQPDVVLARYNCFERDANASEVLEERLDGYLNGGASHTVPFDARQLFHLMHYDSRRGKRSGSVREIMAASQAKPYTTDKTTDSQNLQIKRTNNSLRDVPMKFLKFQEDVRPPYLGTYTSIPRGGSARLGRNPLRRDLPDKDYDYDSEAEWVEDEDAIELDSENEEEEEEDAAEDMDGFLDDEHDDLPKRLVIQGDLEPISTGLCWENYKKQQTFVKMLPYRMEMIVDPTLKSINPFSTEYWEPTPKAHATGPMDPPRLPLGPMRSTNTHLASTHPKPTKPFFALSPGASLSTASSHPPPSAGGVVISSTSTSTSTSASTKPKKLLPESEMQAFKAAVKGSDLTKIGMKEVLKKQFQGDGITAKVIEDTLLEVARRMVPGGDVGGKGKERDKRWVLVEDL